MKRSKHLKRVFMALVFTGLISMSPGCAGARQLAEPEKERPSFTVIDDPIATITDKEPAQWIVQWTAQKDYAGPVNIDIRVSHYNMTWKKIESADAKAELICNITKGRDKTATQKDRLENIIAKFRIASDVKIGDKYKFAITAMGRPFSGVTTNLLLVVAGKLNDKHGPAKLAMHSGPANELYLLARPSLQNDGQVRVALVPTDDLGYPSSFAKPVSVTVLYGKKQLWKGRVKEPEVILLEVPDDDVVRLTAKAKIDGTVETIVSNPIWPAGNNGQIAVFGDLHWHTELSGDATRCIEEGLTAGRDYINLDFVSPSDHAPDAEKWAESVRACDKFNEIDNYTALYAWERSSAKGHVNFYFTNPNHKMNPVNFNYPKEPKKYIEKIPYKNFVAIPHHTNSRGRIRNGKHAFSAYPWGKPMDKYLRLIEIMQSRGNYEREDSPQGWRTDGRNNGASAQVALAKGHKLGFIASTDNHKGWPSIVRNSSRIYAGMWTKRRSRQDIYNALYDRHTWGCWDTRAIVLFEINSAMQGDELTLNQPQKLTARIKMSVEAPLDVLDLVTENDRAISIDLLDDSLDIETQIDLGMVEKSTFFYLRARQTDGALIYASPIFVTVEK